MTCLMNDTLANEVQSLWRKSFPDASLLPVIGLPSNGNGVLTLTHGTGHKMSINGLLSNSPLANNALYSSECINNVYLNLYEIMIPDIPGTGGQPSTAEIYVKALQENDLDVAGVHFHWFGSHVLNNDRGVIAVHHQKSNMHPIDFSIRTIIALHKVMDKLK